MQIAYEAFANDEKIVKNREKKLKRLYIREKETFAKKTLVVAGDLFANARAKE